MKSKKIFKKNLDVLLAIGFVLIGAALFFWVKNTCKGAGCVFGFALVLFALFDSVIFSVVSVLKGKAEKNFVKVAVAVISIFISAVILIVIFGNVRF